MTIEGSDRGKLGALLRAAHSPYDQKGIEALIAGVLGAPAEIGTSWHRLVADPVTPELAQALEALREQRAEGYRDGLGREDFARLPGAERLGRLRRELSARGLDGFVVPRADEHQGEYVPPRGQRLAWLTGFNGSAGLAVVLRKRAALFVDGRYTLQAAQQVDRDRFEIHHLIDEPPASWIGAALRRARCSATIRGCTPRMRSSGFALRRKRQERGCAPSPTTRSTGSGPASRPHRWRRWCPMRMNLPARMRASKAHPACPRRSPRKASPRRC